jgi:hypothetical protein
MVVGLWRATTPALRNLLHSIPFTIRGGGLAPSVYIYYSPCWPQADKTFTVIRPRA